LLGKGFSLGGLEDLKPLALKALRQLLYSLSPKRLLSQDYYLAKVIGNVNQSLISIYSQFEVQHNTHFNRIEQEYSNLYQKINAEKYQPSTFLRNLQETERKYIGLQIWSEQVYQAIVEAKRLFR